MRESAAPTVWPGRFEGRVVPGDCSALGAFLEESEGQEMGAAGRGRSLPGECCLPSALPATRRQTQPPPQCLPESAKDQ